LRSTRDDSTPDTPKSHDHPSATEYTGPVMVTTHAFGAHRVKVVRPADPDRLLDDPVVRAWNRSDDYMPYWAYLWPGASFLAEAVASEPWPVVDEDDGCPPRVLEIGCGVGLAGLVALARGLRVEFTDYDRAPLHFVDRSVRENGLDASRYATSLLDWRDLPDRTYPIILGSDVLYERRLVPLVASLLAKMLSPGGQGLIACPGRASAEAFPVEVTSRGLICRQEPVEARSEEGRPIVGVIHRVRRDA
jgi:predicted nicotinamide N-methyase